MHTEETVGKEVWTKAGSKSNRRLGQHRGPLTVGIHYGTGVEGFGGVSGDWYTEWSRVARAGAASGMVVPLAK